MSNYHLKKKHIYAYRRRKRAHKYIQKLDEIVEESSTRDLKRIMNRINDLWWKIREKLGFFDDFKPWREIRKSKLEKRIESGESRFAVAAAQYICPSCSKKGYLCSPNLNGEKLDLHVLHILWDEKEVHICHIGKAKRNQILILDRPKEGILTMR
jgi:hypothetical protein